MVPSPSTYHQQVSRNLGHQLWEFVHDRELGQVLDAPCDVVMGEGPERKVVQPDLFFVSKGRLDIIVQEEVQGAPDLVVEILSPGTEERDRGYKKTLYARYGVREYWIVDPQAKTVEVFTREGKGFRRGQVYKGTETLRSPLLEGLMIDLQEVF